MAHGAALLFDLVARDGASPAFLKVAGAADKAAASTMRAQKNVAGSTALMARSGAKLTKGLTLPLLAITAIGAKQAIEYQKQQALLRTAAGESEANMKQIAGGIKKVSSDTGTSLHQLYEGMYVVAKAAKSRGWTGAEQLEILRAAAQGAKSENVELGVATDALTTTMVDFHAKAGDAVMMENQLIKASGLAKTSYGLFSESLSNVTPIAAAAGLSLAEVGGAVATMTQHGVTAQRATDNLRNLIFNLTGQNNVASQAMQQLGIDTVDLAKNLGKRGLTGTLAIVDRAMKTHTKNGMVVVDIQKASKLATGSLNTMMGSFSGKLKENSKALLNGGMGLKDYKVYAQSLGGTNGAAAMQFLGLTKNALGFSNQLKSGKGTITTSVQQYQKMLGGMTGAAVAMQVAGKYAGDNAKNVKAVGDAAKHAGKDVHGWELTQKTLAYKLDDAKNKASLFATALGEKALPVLGKIADAGTSAFKWVDGLGDNQKEFLGWGLGIALAVGPALSILGKLGSAGTRFATFAGASESAATRVGASMQRIGAAIGGLALVYGGTQTKGTGGAIMGALGGGMTGAAIGSFFGPIGTAVGTIGGAIAGLGAHFLTAGDDADKAGEKAKAALDAQKVAADGLLSSLQATNGAYNEQYKQTLIQDLQKKGVLGKASTAGINPQDVVSSILGDKGATNRIFGTAGKNTLGTAYDKAGKVVPNAGIFRDRSGLATSLDPRVASIKAPSAAQVKAYTDVTTALANLSPAAKKAQQDFLLVSRAAGKGVVPAEALAGGLKTLRAQLTGTGTSLDKNTAFGARNSQVISEYGANLATAGRAQLEHGKGIKTVTAAYDKNYTAMRSQLVAMKFEPAAIDKILGKYKAFPATIINSVAVSKKELKSLANLKVTPKLKADPTQANAVVGRAKFALSQLQGGKVIGIKADSKQAVAEAKKLQRIILLLTGKTVPLDADPKPAKTKVEALQAQIRAIQQSSSPLINANTALGQTAIAGLQAQIDALTGKTVIVTTQFNTKGKPLSAVDASMPNPKKKGKQPANGMVLSRHADGSVPGFSKPGRESHVAQIAKAGEWRLWAEDETGGEAYIPLALSKRERSRQIAIETVKRLGGVAMFAKGGITHEGKDWIYGGTKYASKRAAENAASRKKKSNKDALSQGVSTSIGNIGQAYSPPFSVSDVGAGRLASTVASAAGKLDAAIRQGLSKRTAASLRGQIRGLVSTANKQLAALRVKVRGSDMAALRSGLKSSVDDTRTALSQLYTDMKNSGVGKTVQSAIQKAGAGVASMRSALDTANEKLSTMKDYASGIGDTLRGAFDATKSGSISDFLAGIGGATDQNNTYKSQLSGLLNRSKGNKTLTDFVNEVAASGNTATLATLAGSSAAELAQVSKAVGGYNSSVQGGVDAATAGKFGGLTVAQQQKNITDLTKKMTTAVTTMGQILALIPEIQLNIDGKPLDRKINAAQKKQLDALVHQLQKGKH